MPVKPDWEELKSLEQKKPQMCGASLVDPQRRFAPLFSRPRTLPPPPPPHHHHPPPSPHHPPLPSSLPPTTSPHDVPLTYDPRQQS